MATKAYGRMVFWEGASLWVLGTGRVKGPIQDNRRACCTPMV